VSCLARITIKQHLCCFALPFTFVLTSLLCFVMFIHVIVEPYTSWEARNSWLFGYVLMDRRCLLWAAVGIALWDCCFPPWWRVHVCTVYVSSAGRGRCGVKLRFWVFKPKCSWRSHSCPLCIYVLDLECLFSNAYLTPWRYICASFYLIY